MRNEALKDQLWNQDDQFKNQYSTPAKRAQIEKRWEQFAKGIKTYLSPKKEITALDLGCGDGVNILGLKKIFEELNIPLRLTGCDFNPNRLAKVKERFPGVEADQIDIIKDPAKQTFDLILFNHVLEHIKEDHLALKNLYSLLNDDGLAIVGVPNEGCLAAQLRNRILQRSILKTTDHVQFYTQKTLVPKIEAAGFQVLHIDRNGFFLPHLRMNHLVVSTFGPKPLSLLGRLFPSQSGEMILFLKKKR